MVVYCTTNIVNNKKYIGQDKVNDPNYLGSGTLLLRDIEKYGKHNFEKKIIQFCNSLEEMNIMEKYWIKFYDAVNSNCFYNIAKGGNGNLCPTSIKVPILCYDLNGEFLESFECINNAARKLKIDRSGISMCCKGKIKRFKNFIFKKFEEELIEKIEPYKHPLEDKKRTKETIDKIANKNRGKKRTKEQSLKCGVMRGKTHSQETRLKMSISAKGKMRTKEHQDKLTKTQLLGVLHYDLNNNLIAEYSSLKEAAEKLGITSSTVCEYLKGKLKTKRGFILKYK